MGISGIFLIGIGATVFFSYGILYGLTLIVPGLLFAGLLWVARQASNADPFMVDVVIRQFKYQQYYAPHPDLGVEHPQIPKKDWA